MNWKVVRGIVRYWLLLFGGIGLFFWAMSSVHPGIVMVVLIVGLVIFASVLLYRMETRK